MEIYVNVPADIFDSQDVKRRVDKIFEETKALFKTRFDEIIIYVMSRNSTIDFSGISIEDVLLKFKEIFFEKVSTLAVKNAFLTENHDLKSNLIDVLNKDKVEKAIMGQTMIEAFSDIIRNIPTDEALSSCLKGSMIIMLRKYFLKAENKPDIIHPTVVSEASEMLFAAIRNNNTDD